MATVQFILGRSGFGKTRHCIDAACEQLIAGGDQPLILLVPEQATYQAERAVLSHPGIRGFSRLRVLSFNRLGFWLGLGQDRNPELSHTGKQMVLHKLLLEMSNQLHLYKGDPRRTGLAGKLSDLLAELQSSECSSQQITMLAKSLTDTRGEELAAAKWSDIAEIYSAYEQFFNELCFSNPDAALSRVRKNVRSAPFLSGARLWVDGFSGFSIQELNLLSEIIDICSNVSIALCLDPATMDLDNADESKLDPCSLFASTEQTYCQMLRMLKAGKHDIAKPVLLTEPKRFENAQALGYLETTLSAPPNKKTPPISDSLHIAACSDVRAETLYIARQIRQLVQRNEFRYRDIAVVTPVMDTYQHYIKSAFDAYSMPYFIDRPRLMKTHPLAQLIGSALQAVSVGFTLPDVLSFLKTGMAGIPAEQVDALETYCRAFDIHSGQWRQKQPWDFAPDEDKHFYDESMLDKVRRNAIAPLLRLSDTLGAADSITAADFICGLWDLLKTLDVQNVLAEWAADNQQEHEQLFSELVSLADEMCKIFQDCALPADTWSSIFSEALSNLTVKLIPPTLDQVLVGSIERSRHPDIKVVFLIGAVQKQFPIPVIGEQLLSEQDYKTAAAAELDLADAYSRQLALRPYLSYIALTRASQQVYLTYPLLDEKGSAVIPWSGLERLQSEFSDLKVQYPSFNIEPGDIQTPEQLSQYLAATLGRDRVSGSRQQAVGSSEQIAAGILDCMAGGDDALKQIVARVKNALKYDNLAMLENKVAEKLFTFPMKTSVSRLEMFAKCPYQYFAKYTLGLEPRKLLRFEPMDVGKFYHAVLEAMFNTLKSQGKNWADLEKDELLEICEEQIEQVLTADAQLTHFMQRRAHHAYRIEVAKETLRKFVPLLAQLARASRFKQTAAELKFGFDDKFQFILSLDNGKQIHFRGFIDRLDTTEIDGQTAGLVYDYKSSTKRASFPDMFYGLDLQLPGYLLALKAKDITPVGAFFIPIDTGTPGKKLSSLGQQQDKFSNKAHGLFNGDYAGAVDTSLGSGWSSYYNFYASKDGPFGMYKNSGALKPEDFEALLSHTEACAKKLIADLAAGTITVTPYRLGATSPCTYCDYRPLCRFDWQVNDYNILETVDKEQALQKMKGV